MRAHRTVLKEIKINLKARARLRRRQTAKVRSQRLKYMSPDQLAYADLLDVGVTIGRFVLGGMFIIYVFGFVEPKVPLSELPYYWSIPADQYSLLVGVGTGWSWLKLVGYGDYMNFLGIAFLVSLTGACYVGVLPFSLRRKDNSFSAILLLQVVVLLLAASGLLAVAH
jgi:hypothetical protein